MDLFCPLPVTRIVSSADEVAAALLDLVQRQFAGEGGESVILGFTNDHLDQGKTLCRKQAKGR